jgi:hypothetical protein
MMTRRLALSIALLLGALATSVAAGPEQLPPAAPYLQNGQVGTTTLVWRHAPAADATVEWWSPDGGPRRRLRAPAAYHREVPLTGLRPGERYAWRVRQGDRTWEGAFLANRGPEADRLRFAAVGDLGSGADAEGAIARGIEAWGPELVVAPGDIVYPNGAYADYGPHFFGPYGSLLAKAPLYPALGNHDVRTADGAPYLAAFSLPAEPGGERWYTFRHGPAQFFALDSTRSLRPGSPQYEWLARDGAASTARWKIAFLHHPAFSSGLHGPHGPIRRDLVPLLARLGFDLAITGHDHHYERFRPQGGVTWVLTGGGGGLLYRAHGGPETVAVANGHHFMGFQIAGDTLALRAIGQDGRVFDAAAIRAKR